MSKPLVLTIGMIALLVLLTNTSAIAQQPDTVWVRAFGADGSNMSMDIEIVDDGIVVIGTRHGMGLPADTETADMWLFKVDFDGNTLWEREFGGDTADQGNAIAVTPDGGLICAGGKGDFEGEDDEYIVKTDNMGIVEWEMIYPSTYETIARDIDVTPDGGYIITGSTKQRTPWPFIQIESFLHKIDANGVTEWLQIYGGRGHDETWSVEVLEDGYVFAGRTRSTGAGMRDAVIAKADLQGNMLWFTTHGGIYKDHIYEMDVLPDGSGFIGTGKTESFGEGYYEYGDIWLLRFDEFGNFMWRSVVGTPPTEFGRSIDIYPNGDYLVTGLTSARNLQNQIFIGRFDPDGNIMWYDHFGGPGMDDAWSVRLIDDVDFIVAGHSEAIGTADHGVIVIRYTEVTP